MPRVRSRCEPFASGLVIKPPSPTKTPSRLPRLLSITALALLLSAAGCSDPEPDVDRDAGPSSDAETTDTVDPGADATDASDTADPDADDNDTGPAPIETHFTRPEPDQRDHVLEDLVIDLLAEVPDDATVRAAYYTFSRTRAAEAFGDARDRGVDLELIVDNDSRHDDGSDWQAVQMLRDRLGDDFFICRDDQNSGGCHGPGIQHNKFITFSELGDGSEEVVLQSSANLTNPQLEQFNNTVLIRGDSTLYDAYLDYWHDLRADEEDLDYYRTVEGDLETKIHLFPLEFGDPIVDILEDVDCDEQTRLHVGMAYFTDPRYGVADELTDRAEEGCDVHALVRAGRTVGLLVLPELETSDVQVSVYDRDDDLSFHSKYLLLDGTWQGEDDRRIVWTGSHNYTGPALRDNDEVLLRIENDAIYDDFLTDWKHAVEYADDADQ